MLPKVNWKTHPMPFSLQQWIQDNRSELKPPIGNKMVFGKGAEVCEGVIGAHLAMNYGGDGDGD